MIPINIEMRERMQKKTIFSLLAIIIALGASVSYALVEFSKEGIWHDTWPKELEKLRKQSRSYGGFTCIEEKWHEITFQKREEFEQAWPHILKLKTKGAPLIIESVNNSTIHPRRVRTLLQAGIPGVRILSSDSTAADTHRLYSEWTRETRYTPWRETWPTPWPDYIKLPSGGLPEYVVFQEGKWIAADIKQFTGELGPKGEGRYCRARVDIVLISDGKIVDLNRIPLPPDTPIIDKRFEGNDNN